MDKVPERRGPDRVYLALGLIFIALGYLQRAKVLSVLFYLEHWAAVSSPYTAWLLAAFCGLWATLCLPGPPLLGLVGTLYAEAPLVGLAVVLAGDTIATIVGFQITRRLARERVRALLVGKPWYEWLEDQVAAKGLYGVFIVRMMPFFPNSLANYALGLTSLPFWPYLGASVAGSIPNLALYVFGSAGVVALVRDGLASRLSLNEGFLLILCLALLARILQRVSRRRLSENQESSAAEPPQPRS